MRHDSFLSTSRGRWLLCAAAVPGLFGLTGCRGGSDGPTLATPARVEDVSATVPSADAVPDTAAWRAFPALRQGEIAFSVEGDSGHARGLVLDLATGRTRAVTPGLKADDVSILALPGSRDLLVQSGEDAHEGEGRMALWRYDAAADSLRPLRLTSGVVQAPTVTPDGRAVVFEANFQSFRDVYRYTFATDKIERLTDHRNGNFDPSLLPDGRIVFASSREGQAEIYAMPSGGESAGEATRLTAIEADDFTPRVSPDGRWIAFTSLRERAPRLFLVAPDGTNLRRLLPEGAEAPTATTAEGRPAWAPDGRTLAFELDPGDGSGVQLWASRVADGRRWRLGSGLVEAHSPAWAPGSDAVAFVGRAQGGTAALYVQKADGSGAPVLVATGGVASPTWLR